MSLTAEVSKWETVPTGEYLAQITNTKDSTKGEFNTQFGNQFLVIFELVETPKLKTIEQEHDVELAGKQVRTYCNQKLGLQDPAKDKDIRSKLTKLAEAAYNRKIEVGETFEIDWLIGRRLVIVVIDKDGKNSVEAFKSVKGQMAMPAGGPDGSFDAGEAEPGDSGNFAGLGSYPADDDMSNVEGLPATAAPISDDDRLLLREVCEANRVDSSTLGALIIKMFGKKIKVSELISSQLAVLLDAVKIAGAEAQIEFETKLDE